MIDPDLGDVHYNANSTQARFGPIKIQASTQKPVPTGIGYATIVIGGVLIVAGTLKKQ